MTTRLTRAQIHEALHPGDVVIVHYLKGDAVSAGIQFFSKGTASHALCCLGGLEVVEADAGGIMHSYVDTYMHGQCRLTVKRAPHLSHEETLAACDFWRSQISKPYDYGMIVRMALVLPVRRFILPVAPPLARLLIRAIGLLHLSSRSLSTCAELWARGVRQKRPKFLKHYAAEDVTPEALLRDAQLETIVVWEAPTLAKER